MYARLAFIFTFFVFQFSFGQDLQSSLVNITQEQGLPGNETYCIIRDSKNYMWVASDQGVARLNGTSIKIIGGLPDNVIFKIREDRKGRIWFFSHTHKLSYFLNEKLYLFKFNDEIQDILKSTLILDAYINENDQIIINTAHLRNFIIDIKTGKIDELDHDNVYDQKSWEINIRCINDSFCFAQSKLFYKTSFNSLSINKIATLDKKKYTIPLQLQKRIQFYGSSPGSNGDVFFFTGKFIIKLFSDGSYRLITFKKEILTIKYNFKQQVLYVGLREGGLIQVQNNNLSLIMPFDILNEKSVTSIAFDNEGGEWFSTLESGIYYNKARYITKLVQSKVLRIDNYNDSILLYANREGIFQYKNGTSTQLIKEKIRTVFDIKNDKDGDIIVMGEFESLKFNNNYKTIYPTVIGGRKQNIYFVTASSGLSKETDSSYIFRHSVTLFRYTKENNREYEASFLTSDNLPELGHVLIDSYRNIWFVGLTHLYIYKPQQQKFALFQFQGLLPGGISSMQQMPDGHYVVGSRTGGIIVYDRTSFSGVIDESKGLLNNAVKHTLSVANNLWVATSNGISVINFRKFDPLEYSIKNFGENAGLNNQVIYQLSTFQDKILVATGKGVYQIDDLKNKISEAPQVLPLYITSISYYKGDTSKINSISLPYNHNRLVVNFDAITFNSPGGLEYYYRMINSDSTWYTISSSQLVLDELLPGNYLLQIKAGVPLQKRFSAIQTLSIVIKKPWWQKHFVIALAILLLLGLLYSFYSWRIKKISIKERDKTLLKEKLMDLEQTALRSQMNPHFIFNCLSSIQQLVLSGDKDEANEYLVKFARLIRKTLELSSSPFITLAREKKYLTEYVEMEQLRLANPFKFEFFISEEIDINRIQLPNMMLQPVIENSIRHGIKSLQNRSGIVSIKIEKMSDYLQCEITDNGIGRENEIGNKKVYKSHKSFGLSILSRRLEGLADGQNYFIRIIDLKDESGVNHGTKVILHLPYKIN